MAFANQSNNSSRRPGKKCVLILYTGGTMGMKKQPNGSLAPVPGYLTLQIKECLPEMYRDEMPDFEIKEYETLIDSSCMGVEDWVTIAADIETNYDKYCGFVVLMGTDTMAYASSAISFMLENLSKPVVFTGSQVPFCEIYSDARRNLIGSIIFASRGTFKEVCVFFNDKLLRATRTVKVNSVGLSAFDSPNFPPLAILGAFIEEHAELAIPSRVSSSVPLSPVRPTPVWSPSPQNRTAPCSPHGVCVHRFLEAKIIVLKLVPGFDEECVLLMVRHAKVSLKGIVLEMYGTGNGPSHKETLLQAIKEARAKGIVCVAITQCVQGGVSLDSYSMGLEFKNAGVVSGGDMTTEACSTKLAYLFGVYQSAELVEKELPQCIRGEITTAQDMNQVRKRKHYFPSSDSIFEQGTDSSCSQVILDEQVYLNEFQKKLIVASDEELRAAVTPEHYETVDEDDHFKR